MPKVTVRGSWDISKLLEGDFVDEATRSQMEETVVWGSIAMIRSGQSPVAGVGRFEPYVAVDRVNKAKKVVSLHRKLEGPVKEQSMKERAFGKMLKLDVAEAKKGYPYSVMKEYPGKTVRPVNLELSGDMLAALECRIHPTGMGVEVGIFPDADDAIQKRAEAHNFGTHPYVPQRQFLPGPDDEFAQSIMRAIRGLYEDRLRAIIEESNS